MSDLAELLAQAVNPSMSRAEREQAYGVVRSTALHWPNREGLAPDDDGGALRRHLAEEAIRDVEIDIARFLALEEMARIAQAQEAEEAARVGRRPATRSKRG